MGLLDWQGLFNWVKRLLISSCQDQELVRHLPIELSFLLCKFSSRKGCSLKFLPAVVKILGDGLIIPTGYVAFSKSYIAATGELGA